MGQFYVYAYLDQLNIPLYIGKGQNRRYRISGHKNQFLKNKIKKIGEDNIKISFLNVLLNEQEAFYWEKFWIATIGRRDLKLGPLCNLSDGGEGPVGRIFSEEHRKKISIANKGKKLSEERKQAISEANKKRIFTEKQKEQLRIARAKQVFSEETKKKISLSSKGKVISLETRLKISQSSKGRKFTANHKRKIGIANKGHKMPAHVKEALRIANLNKPNNMLGKKHSKESKEKMSIAQKKRFQKDSI